MDWKGTEEGRYIILNVNVRERRTRTHSSLIDEPRHDQQCKLAKSKVWAVKCALKTPRVACTPLRSLKNLIEKEGP